MAADDAAVTVTLRANLKDYEAALKQAVRATERAATQAEKAISNVGKGGGASNVIAVNFQKSAGQIANDAKVLQYQLNDIFSGMASGQGIRALQQQLGQIAQQMSGGSLAQGARTMGAALVGMINPVNLAVVAFGFLASAAAEYFLGVEEDAEKANQALANHAAAVRKMADTWGDVVPGLREVADELERIAKVQDLVSAAGEVTADRLAKVAAEVQKLIEAGGTPIPVLIALEDLKKAGEGVITVMKDGRAAGAEYADFQKQLADLLATDAVKSNQDLSKAITELATAYSNAAMAASQLHAQEAAREGTQSRLQRVNNGAGVVPFNQLPAQDMNILAARDRIKAIESSGNYKAVGPVTASGDRAYGAYQVMGSNIAEWTKKAIGTAITSEQFLNNPAIQDKVFDTIFGGYMQQFGPEGAAQAWFGGPGAVGKTGRKDSLGTSVGGYGKKFMGGAAADPWAGMRDTIPQVTQNMQALNQQATEFQNIAKGAIGGLVQDLLAGKDAAEAVSSALAKVGEQLLNLALSNMFGGGMGGTGAKGGLLGGMLIPGILHKGGIAGSDGYGHGRAVPASAFRNARRYHSGGLVGGEVPAILQRGEIVLPKGSALKRGGNSTHNIVMQDDSGRMAAIADQRIRTASGDIIQLSTQTSMKAVKNNFSKMAIDSERRQR